VAHQYLRRKQAACDEERQREASRRQTAGAGIRMARMRISMLRTIVAATVKRLSAAALL